MQSKEFVSLATKTESLIPVVKFNKGDLQAAIQTAMISGMLLDAVKKNVFYGKPINIVDLMARLDEMDKAMKVSPNEFGEGVPQDLEVNPRLFHGVLGIFTEAVELVEALYANMYEGKPLDMVNIGEELGDMDWYKAILLSETGLSEEGIREKVIAKLKARYGDKFSSEAAITRDLTKERAVLEA